MIVITGAAGFIGSCVTGKFNQEGLTDLVLADDFSNTRKTPNYIDKKFRELVHRDELASWLEKHAAQVSHVIHIGARTDTTEFDTAIFDRLNLHYTQQLWNICSAAGIKLIYASSAATYGMGEMGYKDDESKIPLLKPLNPYGESKNDFDKWAIQQDNAPPLWHGLKFFNVYGPNEYHKGRMASVIFHSFHQIKDKGSVKLFRSHHPDYKDGGQLRDFVYVKDVMDVIWYLYSSAPASGIYNLGSGRARTFLDLAKATFAAMGKKENIEFIDTPIDIRDKYQYFTEADMSKLISTGYKKPFHSLEDGMADYVKGYLLTGRYL